METTQGSRASSRGRRHRWIVVSVVGAVALGLGITAVHASLGGTVAPGAPTEPSLVATMPTHGGAPGAVVHPVPVTKPSRAPDPYALADGDYPTYVRAVDVAGATITIDVLQTFFGADMRRAAMEDGVAWRDVRYNPVYIRNENPLLRTLPVARDARIKMIGMCMAPSRVIGLTELRHEAIDVDPSQPDLFYYEITVADGTVTAIFQRVALPAC